MAPSKFASDCLEAHNDKRKKHGVPKLKLNSELCVLAENWALHLLGDSGLKHSNHQYKGQPLGENIAAKTSSAALTEYKGLEVVEQWYAEGKNYDFKSPGSTGLTTGHFSQIVWKGSQEFGIGMASKSGKCIVVAHYYPAGNVVGRHKENVFPCVSKSKSSAGKLKELLGKGKKGDDSSSSSSDEDESKKGAKKSPRAMAAQPPSSSSSFGTSKVTVTKTITKPDGTTETIVEERYEEITPEKLGQLKLQSHKSGAASSKAEKGQSTSEFRQDALKTHNMYRAKHGVSQLKMNTELCALAEKWAQHLASISSLQHSNHKHGGEILGENCASKWGSSGADYTGKEVVEQWYSEEPAYDYSGRSNSGKAGHFSQVVWKSSSELGIGKAKDSNGRVYVVANYKPAGNILGRFAENVLRQKSRKLR